MGNQEVTFKLRPACPLCGHEEYVDISSMRDDDNKNPTRFTCVVPECSKEQVLALCSLCSLVYFKSYPEGLETLYRKLYRSEGSFDTVARKRENLAKSILFYENIRQYLKPNMKVLDIGCSEGFFVEFLNKRGYKATGLELNEYSCAYAHARGLELISLPLEWLNPEEHQYDFIFASGLLEHVHDPLNYLGHIKKHLKGSGFVYIGVPDLFSPNKNYLSDFFAPEHLQTFSLYTLQLLFMKAGFRVIKYYLDNYNNGLAFICGHSLSPNQELEYDKAAPLRALEVLEMYNRGHKYLTSVNNHTESLLFNLNEYRRYGLQDSNMKKLLKTDVLIKRLQFSDKVKIYYKLRALLEGYQDELDSLGCSYEEDNCLHN